jgi:pseudoazurin
MDEPTNHLDIQHQIGLLSLVKREKLTVIAALHDLNHAAMFCDRIIVMTSGHMAMQGKPTVFTRENLHAWFGIDAVVEHEAGSETVLFVIKDLMNFKEESMKYLKQSLKVCVYSPSPFSLRANSRSVDEESWVCRPMVYEPDYLEIQPGDTVKFIRKHKSHNAASIAELSPADYPGFMGKIDEEIEVTYDNPGFYGIKCSPHYAQGMVMMIKVGDTTLPDSYRAFKAPGIADKRFQEIYARIDKQ